LYWPIQSGSAIITSDTSIGHNCSTQNCRLEEHVNIGSSFSTLQVGIGQVGIKENFLQESTLQVRTGEIGTINVGLSHISPTQVSVGQVCTSQSDFPHFGIKQNSPLQISLAQVAGQPGSGQIRLTQISSHKTGINEISVHKLGIHEISIRQDTALEVSPHQPDVTQIAIAQISSTQINPTEIPLTGSITLQQFLGSHNYTSQNTTVPTWLSFLTNTTPFNLTLDIRDLPTGQLAEAQLTGFDANGRPNAGTLLLDYNGNNLGWFYCATAHADANDPTPWENSEFETTLSNTAFRANSTSAAAGRYDLTLIQKSRQVPSTATLSPNGQPKLIPQVSSAPRLVKATYAPPPAQGG
jgi:hypothetical protein